MGVSRMEDMALSKRSRAELLLEKTELEDEIREILPFLKRKRNGALGFTGLAAAGVASGVLWAGNSGFLIALLAFIFSIPPWFFFGLSARDVRGLEKRVSAAEAEMKETEESGASGASGKVDEMKEVEEMERMKVVEEREGPEELRGVEEMRKVEKMGDYGEEGR